MGVAVFQYRDVIFDSLNEHPARLAAQHSEAVILYATSWCGYCGKTRDFLQANDIDYIEYDIEESAVGREQYEKLRGHGIPLLLVNGTVVRGYDPERIKDLL